MRPVGKRWNCLRRLRLIRLHEIVDCLLGCRGFLVDFLLVLQLQCCDERRCLFAIVVRGWRRLRVRRAEGRAAEFVNRLVMQWALIQRVQILYEFRYDHASLILRHSLLIMPV